MKDFIEVEDKDEIKSVALHQIVDFHPYEYIRNHGWTTLVLPDGRELNTRIPYESFKIFMEAKGYHITNSKSFFSVEK